MSKTTQLKKNRDNGVDKGKLLNFYFIDRRPEADIARFFKVSPQTINKQLQPFKAILSGRDTLQAYRERYPDILSSVELKLMQELVDAPRLKKATTGNIAYALDKITTHRRLHSGLSTGKIELDAVLMGVHARIFRNPPQDVVDTQDIVCSDNNTALDDDADKPLINNDNQD